MFNTKFSENSHLTKTCERIGCDNMFSGKNPSSYKKYCSKECKDIARRLRYFEEHPVVVRKIVCVNPSCKKIFESENHTRKYCSESCYKVNQLKRSRNRRIKKREALGNRECLWCRKSLTNMQRKFCGQYVCSNFWRTIEKRIRNTYVFDDESVNREIVRLMKLGKFYTFPKKYSQLNIFYNLKGEPKNE